jgi:serine/threonine protein kinase
MADTTAALGPSRRYGRYAITQSLGDGAMGDVFRARDTVLGRDVALKVMKAIGPDLATFRARFEAEARALARLQHPSAVQVFDVGWEGDQPYLVMELVGGGTLRGHLDAGPLPADEVRSLGIQVGNALAAAHDHGILHRDVKPANILGERGRWKLADFGIAHVPGSELTMTGQFLGTPAYAAPSPASRPTAATSARSPPRRWPRSRPGRPARHPHWSPPSPPPSTATRPAGPPPAPSSTFSLASLHGCHTPTQARGIPSLRRCHTPTQPPTQSRAGLRSPSLRGCHTPKQVRVGRRAPSPPRPRSRRLRGCHAPMQGRDGAWRWPGRRRWRCWSGSSRMAPARRGRGLSCPVRRRRRGSCRLPIS